MKNYVHFAEKEANTQALPITKRFTRWEHSFLDEFWLGILCCLRGIMFFSQFFQIYSKDNEITLKYMLLRIKVFSSLYRPKVLCFGQVILYKKD